jgi:hypothetical protein
LLWYAAELYQSKNLVCSVSVTVHDRRGRVGVERHLGKYMGWSWILVAMENPACLGTVGAVGNKLGVANLSAEGEAQAADEFVQHFGDVVMVALHKINAAKGVSDVVICHHMTTSTHPVVAERGECAISHEAASYILSLFRHVVASSLIRMHMRTAVGMYCSTA